MQAKVIANHPKKKKIPLSLTPSPPPPPSYFLPLSSAINKRTEEQEKELAMKMKKKARHPGEKGLLRKHLHLLSPSFEEFDVINRHVSNNYTYFFNETHSETIKDFYRNKDI